jgi:hypothetical protein
VTEILLGLILFGGIAVGAFMWSKHSSGQTTESSLPRGPLSFWQTAGAVTLGNFIFAAFAYLLFLLAH